jgi:hypothetical protein
MSFEPRDYLRHILIEADYLIDPACARFTCSTPRHRFSFKRTPILTSGATWTGIRTTRGQVASLHAAGSVWSEFAHLAS